MRQPTGIDIFRRRVAQLRLVAHCSELAEIIQKVQLAPFDSRWLLFGSRWLLLAPPASIGRASFAVNGVLAHKSPLKTMYECWGQKIGANQSSPLEPTRALRLKQLFKLESHLELRSQLELQKRRKRSQLEQICIFNLKYLKLGQFGAAENLHTYFYLLM